MKSEISVETRSRISRALPHWSRRFPRGAGPLLARLGRRARGRRRSVWITVWRISRSWMTPTASTVASTTKTPAPIRMYTLVKTFPIDVRGAKSP